MCHDLFIHLYKINVTLYEISEFFYYDTPLGADNKDL